MSINRVVLAGIFSFPYGDAPGSRIKNLALGFKEQIDDVHVVSSFYDNNTPEYRQNGVELVQGASISFYSVAPLSAINATSNFIDRVSNRFLLLKYNRQLVDAIIENLRGDANEILFLYGRSYLFLNGVLRRIAQKGYQTKVIFDVVEPPRIETSRWEYLFHPFVIDSSLAFWYLLPKFDLCTFISYKLLEVYGADVQRKLVVPSVMYGATEYTFSPKQGTQLRLGYLGSLFDKDYPSLMFDLCALLWDKKIDFSFSMVGRFKNFADGRRWEKAFSEAPFSTRIRYHADPNEAEKWEIIRQLDFMLCFREPTLLQEFTFPTRVPELLALGKVLVVNDFGDFGKYFKSGHNAILVKENAIHESVDMIGQYVLPENYAALRTRSQTLLKTHFNAAIQAGRIIEELTSK